MVEELIGKCELTDTFWVNLLLFIGNIKRVRRHLFMKGWQIKNEVHYAKILCAT